MFKEVVEVFCVDEEKVKVKFLRGRMCSCCSFSSLCNTQDALVWVDKPGFELKEGDKVEVGIEERANLTANFLMFLLPSALFISVLLILRDRPPFLGFLAAVSTVAIYYIFLRLLLRRKGKSFRLKVIRKV